MGMDDSDEDSDEDEHNNRIRRNMHKKQKIDRHNIKALGQLSLLTFLFLIAHRYLVVGEDEETKSFYRVYEQDLMDDNNNELAHLQQESQLEDIVMSNLGNDSDAAEEEEEPPEYVSREEIVRRVRQLAQTRAEVRPISIIP